MAAAVALIFICAGCVNNSGEEAAVTPALTAAPTLTPAPETPEPTALPANISDELHTLSISPDSLDTCGQLVTVKADGSAAQISAYERSSSCGWRSAMPDVAGRVGIGGVTEEKTEGDKKTPAGLYGLGMAFGTEPEPETKLSYRQIDGDSYWVDDGASPAYNTWVEGAGDWRSAEHLADHQSAYALAVVIEYNTDPVVPYAGSAIFLHCGSTPTAGCVSIAHEDMARILKWLDPSANPMILICP